MIAKVAAVVVGLGAIGTGSVALAKQGWFGMMPRYTTLESKTLDNNKWVNEHKKHFVDSKDNEEWFDWVFKNRYQVDTENKKSKFEGIKKGGKESEENSLAKACKEAYEAETSKVKTQATDITDSNKSDHFFEDNIWRYCSVNGKKTQ